MYPDVSVVAGWDKHIIGRLLLSGDATSHSINANVLCDLQGSGLSQGMFASLQALYQATVMSGASQGMYASLSRLYVQRKSHGVRIQWHKLISGKTSFKPKRDNM